MSVRDIKIYPDKILRQQAREIENIDSSINELAEDMLETMYRAPGIGLAANQVGVDLRLIVVDVAPREDRGKNPIILVNPIIVEREGEVVWEEGCLSVPGMNAEVKRNYRVIVKGYDLKEREVTIEGEELLAVVLQHEIDHLDGVLYFDHLSRLKREFFFKSYKKYLKDHVDSQKSKRIRV